MSNITYGPFIGYVFRNRNKWSCRIILETLTKDKVPLMMKGEYSDIEYKKFRLGKAYMHRFIIHGLNEGTHYFFKFDDEVCTLITPSIGTEINIYTLSCDGGSGNYSYYPKNAQEFYNLFEDHDENLWVRLYNDISEEKRFTLTLHLGDNVYCDAIVEYLSKKPHLSKDEILSVCQHYYRKVFNNPYKKKTLRTNSHLMMHGDHDYGSSDIKISEIIIYNLRKMVKYYQHLLYEDPIHENKDFDIYIDDYTPLGIIMPDSRTNRKYYNEETKYPILSEEQMSRIELFLKNSKLTSIAFCLSTPLTLIAGLLINYSYDGWTASPSRINQRNEIINLLFKSDKKVAVISADLHVGQMQYLSDNKKVIPFLISSGISSYPPTGLQLIVYEFMRFFQRIYGPEGLISSAITHIYDFNYCKFTISEDWEFKGTQDFIIKTYLQNDTDLTINYSQPISRLDTLLSFLY